MTTTRTGALLGVAAALLLTAPAAIAEPEAHTRPDAPTADAVLDVAADRLALDAPPDALTVAADAERVELRWDTTAIEPGSVFGDRVELRTSVAEAPAADAAEKDAAGEDAAEKDAAGEDAAEKDAAEKDAAGEDEAGASHGDPVVVPVAASGTLSVDVPAPGEHLLRVEAAAHALDGRPLAVERDYRLVVTEASRPEVAVEARALPQPPVLAASRPEVAAAQQQQQQQPTGTGRVTLDRGHVDAVAPRLLPDGLHVQVKDGTATGVTTWREPADVEFRVTAAARAELPAQPALSFLGEAGAQVFLLPQTQRADLLWTGWNTEELRPADVSGPVTWTLTAVDGPGAFGLFTTGSFGAPQVLFNSADGLPDTLSVPLGTHAHANWAFAEPGRYRLTFTVSAPGADGPLTDAETLTFVVGDGTPAPQQPGDTGRQTGTPHRLASTGPAALPAAAGLAIALVATGAAALVLVRRRPAKENP
ncbi:choice-of-anchor M domain-containing protein [Saccharothrix sp. 6-C]|uniref:choice-of-anchor M domain-containing protein n=1 Tax=Saccharothrix sp. 6-C TaxID=2781735 RepID=UPI0019177D67|nr:choice-of-anchor M domain-containing protein [Saccharothrix sp. 6-C]QQQ73454.1 choice-of-anchor M domain-containing protein [Saccharothrix sp. 6-C]